MIRRYELEGKALPINEIKEPNDLGVDFSVVSFSEEDDGDSLITPFYDCHIEMNAEQLERFNVVARDLVANDRKFYLGINNNDAYILSHSFNSYSAPPYYDMQRYAVKLSLKGDLIDESYKQLRSKIDKVHRERMAEIKKNQTKRAINNAINNYGNLALFIKDKLGKATGKERPEGCIKASDIYKVDKFPELAKTEKPVPNMQTALLLALGVDRKTIDHCMGATITVPAPDDMITVNLDIRPDLFDPENINTEEYQLIKSSDLKKEIDSHERHVKDAMDENKILKSDLSRDALFIESLNQSVKKLTAEKEALTKENESLNWGLLEINKALDRVIAAQRIDES